MGRSSWSGTTSRRCACSSPPASRGTRSRTGGSSSTSAAVGVPHEVKGEVAWVFCALVPGAEPSKELAGELRELAAAELGKAFAPERVLFVSALPKTRSAKIVRRAVRAKALGSDPGDLSSLENPETLDEIAAAAQA